MAKKNKSNVKPTQVEVNGVKVFALQDGESLITVDDYRKVQNDNVKKTRELNDAVMARKKVEAERDEANKKLGKVRKNKILTGIVAAAIGVTMFFTGWLAKPNTDHSHCISEEQYTAVVEQLEDANAIIETLQETISSYETTIAELEEENAVTKAELEKAKTDVATLQAKLDAANARIDELSVLFAESEKERVELEAEVQSQQSIIDSLQGQIDGYKARIAYLEAQLAQKDQANVNNNQSSSGNGNVSVGDSNEDEVNENDSNIKQEADPYEPIN